MLHEINKYLLRGSFLFSLFLICNGVDKKIECEKLSLQKDSKYIFLTSAVAVLASTHEHIIVQALWLPRGGGVPQSPCNI